jgi:hypothetical protein
MTITNKLTALLISLPLFAFAGNYASAPNASTKKSEALNSIGTNSGGGGDLCEDRIQIIRDDLRSWIGKKGFEALILPKGVTKDQYRLGMLDAIAKAKIKCVGPGDSGYPVEVLGSPKVCKFDKDGSLLQITCDFNKFQSMSETAQYVLVHHEFAGLANIEKPNGADSNYDVSNQITNQLADQFVKRLVVKQAPTDMHIPAHMRLLHEEEDSVRRAFLEEIPRAMHWNCYGYVNGKLDVSAPEMIDWSVVANIVVRARDIRKSKDEQYFSFHRDTMNAYETVAVLKVSENGARIVSAKIINLRKNESQRINVGTLAKPEFRDIYQEPSVESVKICNPN